MAVKDNFKTALKMEASIISRFRGFYGLQNTRSQLNQ